jgi:hypothetical protein
VDTSKVFEEVEKSVERLRQIEKAGGTSTQWLGELKSIALGIVLALLASYGISPSPKPEPVPVPAPSPTPSPVPILPEVETISRSDVLERATKLREPGKAYLRSFAVSLREVAKQVKSKALVNKAEIGSTIAELREPVRVAWVKSLDAAISPGTEANGVIADPGKVAEILDHAAEVLDVK